MALEQLSEQEILRRNSLKALRELGIEPYPAERFDVTTTAAEIAAFEELDYPSKICFTAKEYPYSSTRVLDALDFVERGRVNWEWRHCHRCYDFVEEANKLLELNSAS